jgi:adenine/guanine phosphoribosyltransferase-like PRPP-binding protein
MRSRLLTVIAAVAAAGLLFAAPAAAARRQPLSTHQRGVAMQRYFARDPLSWAARLYLSDETMSIS